MLRVGKYRRFSCRLTLLQNCCSIVVYTELRYQIKLGFRLSNLIYTYFLGGTFAVAVTTHALLISFPTVCHTYQQV